MIILSHLPTKTADHSDANPVVNMNINLDNKDFLNLEPNFSREKEHMNTNDKTRVNVRTLGVSCSSEASCVTWDCRVTWICHFYKHSLAYRPVKVLLVPEEKRNEIKMSKKMWILDFRKTTSKISYQKMTFFFSFEVRLDITTNIR